MKTVSLVEKFFFLYSRDYDPWNQTHNYKYVQNDLRNVNAISSCQRIVNIQKGKLAMGNEYSSLRKGRTCINANIETLCTNVWIWIMKGDCSNNKGGTNLAEPLTRDEIAFLRQEAMNRGSCKSDSFQSIL